MPICTNCGQNNPNDVVRCVKCGVSLGGQLRAKKDAQRGHAASAVNTVIKVVVAVAVLAAVYPTYRFAFTAYYKYRLDTVIVAANKACGGPITSTTERFQKEQIQKCLDSDDNVKTAQENYDNFTKGGKK